MAADADPTTSSAPLSCRPMAKPARPTSPRRWPRAHARTGAKIFEGVGCTGFEFSARPRDRRRHRRPASIRCEKVVLCAGMWSRQIAAFAGVSVPLQPVKHQYVITEKIDGVRPGMATLRDPDRRTYFKEEVGGLVFGGYEPDPIAWTTGDVPDDFEFQLLDDDWDHFEQHLQAALARIPALRTAGIKQMINGPESFTPDGNFILGEAPGGAELLRRRRLQRLRHRLRRRCGMGARRLGECRRAAARSLGGRHPALLGAAQRPRLDARPHARGLRQALHRRLPARRVRERPAAHRLAALRAAKRTSRRPRLETRLGAGQLVRARRRRSARHLFLRPRQLVRSCRRGARGRARAGCAIRPVVLRQIRDDRPRCREGAVLCCRQRRH